MEGKKWQDLKKSIKDVLSQISDNSKDHLVSIINFSTKAIIEYKYQKSDIIDVESLTFFKGDGTNFCAVFDEAVLLMDNDVSDFSTFMVFMTDGQGSYPEEQIKKMKSIATSLKFLKNQFKFFGLVFNAGKQEDEKTMKRIVLELGGEIKFAINGEELKKRYAEIFTKSLENQK